MKVIFNHPDMLPFVVALVSGFVLLNFLWHHLQNRAIRNFGEREVLANFSIFSFRKISTGLFSLALLTLALTLASPVYPSNQHINSSTLNAVVVIDVSRSMFAEDGPDNHSRLEAGIIAVEKLFETYPDGRFGLVTYTSQASAYPPTTDHQSLSTILREIHDHYSVRGEGSNLINALKDAAELTEDSQTDTIILISDGGYKSSNFNQYHGPRLIEKLHRDGINLLIFGIGGYVPTTIPVYNDQGEVIGYHSNQGSVAFTSLDEIPLRYLADESDGWYTRLTDSDTLVEQVQSKRLDDQPVTQSGTTDLTWVFTLISIFLVALRLLLTRIIPRF